MSEPDLLDAIRCAKEGFDRWAAKPHNKRWFRKIDGTPIPNDLCVVIAEAFIERLSNGADIISSDARAAALEEAAKIADSLPGWQQPRDVATAIRALIGQPQGDAGTGGAAPRSEEQG